MQTYIDKVVEKVADATHIKNKDLLHMYALLVLTKKENITAKDVHDAWVMNMNFRPRTDYCYGHEHKSLIPFGELDDECQHKDDKFVNALVRIAKELEE